MNPRFWARTPMGDPGVTSGGREIEISTTVEKFGESFSIAFNLYTIRKAVDDFGWYA